MFRASGLLDAAASGWAWAALRLGGMGPRRPWYAWAKEVILWTITTVALRRWRPRRDLQRTGGAKWGTPEAG